MGKLLENTSPKVVEGVGIPTDVLEKMRESEKEPVKNMIMSDPDKVRDTGLWVNPKIKEDLVHLKDNVDLGKIGSAIAIGMVDPTMATAKAAYDHKDILIDGAKRGADFVKDTFTKDHMVEGAKTGLDVAKHALQYASLEAALPGAGIVKSGIDNKDKILDGLKIGLDVSKDVVTKSPLYKIGTVVGGAVKEGKEAITDKIVNYTESIKDTAKSLTDSVKNVDVKDVLKDAAVAGVGGFGTAASFANAGLQAARAGIETVDVDGPDV